MGTNLWLRLRALARRKQLDRDLEDEIAFHLAMREQSSADEHASPELARSTARRRFGNATSIRETVRDQWTFVSVENFWADLRYAARALAKNPSLCAVAILSLALCIGANTAIFSVMNAVLLRDLPVPEPDRLVLLTPVQTRGHTAWSLPTFREFEKRQDVFHSLVAITSIEPIAAIGGSSIGRIDAGLVTGGYFRTLGVQARFGRTFTASDDHADRPHAVTVLSHRFWQSRFGGDPEAVGRELKINGLPFTIVGVAPPHFQGDSLLEKPDLWLPVAMQPQVLIGRNLLGARNTRWLAVMGRLRDGVSVEAAETAARHLHHALLREEGEAAKTIENVKLVLEPGGRGLAILRGSIARPVKILLGITLLVLLIGCANIANLLLARGAARQTESSVRLALGSGRFRLLRQFLFESSLLALAGCLAGLLLAPLMVQGIIALGEQTRPAAIDARIDSMVLLFTFGLGVVSALVFGTLPAIRFSNANLHGTTQGSSRSVTASRSGQRLSRGLIAGQVSLALLLLIGSGLLVRSLLRITRQDFGFDRTNMITVRIEAGNAGYREPEQFTKLGRTLEARLGSLPGVDSVSFALCGTMGVSGCSRRSDVAVEGYVSQAGEDMGVGVNHVSPNYLETFKMRLSSGRSFNRGDHGSAPKVALVNDALVRRYFPGADPIGRRLWFDTETRKEPIQIIGVVGDHKRNQPREIVEPAVMLSFDQFPERFRHIELRTSVPPGQLLAPVGQAISDLDSRLQVIGPHTMEQALSRLISTELLMARLCTLFGFLAMALACLGVYGVLSYSVVRRTSEIGIRMAMGARRGDVLALIWREAASLVVIGSSLGLGVAIAAGRLLEAFLFGITSRDPVSFAVPTLILFAVTMLAAYLPARRASALNPIRALRYE